MLALLSLGLVEYILIKELEHIVQHALTNKMLYDLEIFPDVY